MLLRLSPERYEALIRYTKEANLNMLRSEGFSIRETDEFYELCDRYGVMVTQQIFGRSIPDEALAVSCIEDMMLRLRPHPSLVHFLGHDETFPTETLDKAYQDLIEKYDVNRTYQPHSGAFNAKDRVKTGGTRTGSREVWTYATPPHYYTHEKTGTWGFAQSGGIGGIVAPYESIRRFIPKEDQWPLWSETMSFHTVIQGAKFFDTVVEQLDARYGPSSGIEEFCTKAMALNYECARGMYEAYGRDKYRANGITTWKYDAAWPAVMTWNYIDWHLLAGGAYYGAKKACEALHPQYAYDDNAVYVINAYYKDFENLKVTAKVLNSDLSVKLNRTETIGVAADGKTKAFVIDGLDDLSTTYFLQLTLDDADGKRISDNFYWLSTSKDIPGEVNGSWSNYKIRPKSIADYTRLNQLPTLDLNATCAIRPQGEESLAEVTVANRTDQLAFSIHLAIKKGQDGEEVAPTYWKDNYFCLLPNESKTVTAVFKTADLTGATPVVAIDGWNIKPRVCTP